MAMTAYAGMTPNLTITGYLQSLFIVVRLCSLQVHDAFFSFFVFSVPLFGLFQRLVRSPYSRYLGH
jgi:hypothetical protein